MIGLILAISLFGWFDNPLGNSGNTEQILAHRNHANMTMTVRPYVEADWDAARSTNQCVMIFWPREVFDLITPGRDIPWSAPVYWPVEDATVGRMIYTFYTHRDQICGILLADEIDCRGGCAYASEQLEWNARLLKWLMEIGYLPRVKIWMNNTSQWAAWFVGDNRLPRDPTIWGVRIPPSVDVISFDAYTRFDQCYGVISCPQLWAGLLARMGSHQQLAMVPRAFTGAYLNWNPATSEVIVMAWSYYNFMRQNEDRFWMIVPFIWRGQNGAMYDRDLSREYIAMAQLITGKREVAPGVVTGVRIVRGE